MGELVTTTPAFERASAVAKSLQDRFSARATSSDEPEVEKPYAKGKLSDGSIIEATRRTPLKAPDLRSIEIGYSKGDFSLVSTFDKDGLSKINMVRSGSTEVYAFGGDKLDVEAHPSVTVERSQSTDSSAFLKKVEDRTLNWIESTLKGNDLRYPPVYFLNKA